MRKDEFLSRLEMLLRDISEEERAEAMAFYYSYFDDAGEANEAKILAELESPEKVAEIIKRDLGMVAAAGQMEDLHEQSHSAAYSSAAANGRKQQNCNHNGNEWGQQQYGSSKQSNPYGSYTDSQRAKEENDRHNNRIVALVIIIGILTSPAWLGVLTGILGTVFGISVALIAITVAMFVVGLVFIGLGIAMISGIAVSVVSIPVGLAFIGVGFFVLAIAILCLLACVAVFGKVFPWVWRGICNLWKKLFAKKEAQTV